MNANFNRALAAVLRHEGGFSDHPRDPGGATNKGVTLDTYRRMVNPSGTVDDLKAISQEQVATVYREGYWDVVKAADLPGGIDYALFDYAVNSGPARAVKALQSVLRVAEDGIVGPVTLAAARAAHPIDTIKKLSDQRLNFLRGLPTWSTFGKGWQRRVDDVTDDAIQMVGTKPTPIPVPDTRPSIPVPPPYAPIPDDPSDAIAPPPADKGGLSPGLWATLLLIVLAILSGAALYLWS